MRKIIILKVDKLLFSFINDSGSKKYYKSVLFPAN
jgi:hypothetical protein